MEQPPALNQAWSTIPSTVAPPPLLYLDTLSDTDFGQAYKRQSFDLLEVQSDQRFLDVGCGPGDDVRALARLMGSGGAVVGVDRNGTMLQEARARSAAQPLAVEFYLGDAHDLPFPTASFDGCRADRVFQHLKQPQVALQKMIRVAKSGGRIVVSEPDWETLVLDCEERATTRKITNFICDQIVRNGWIGRRLPRLFKTSGLTTIAVITVAFVLTDYTMADRLWGLERNAVRACEAGVISANECVTWIESLQEAAQAECFFGTASGFGVCGIKP